MISRRRRLPDRHRRPSARATCRSRPSTCSPATRRRTCATCRPRTRCCARGSRRSRTGIYDEAGIAATTSTRCYVQDATSLAVVEALELFGFCAPEDVGALPGRGAPRARRRPAREHERRPALGGVHVGLPAPVRGGAPAARRMRRRARSTARASRSTARRRASASTPSRSSERSCRERAPAARPSTSSTARTGRPPPTSGSRCSSARSAATSAGRRSRSARSA